MVPSLGTPMTRRTDRHASQRRYVAQPRDLLVRSGDTMVDVADDEGAEEIREYPIALVAHADHGDPECCGLLMPVVRGDQADLVCNECGAILRTVPTAEAEQTLVAMMLTAASGMCSAICPYCGGANFFPGYTSMDAYTCRSCRAGVVVERQLQ